MAKEFNPSLFAIVDEIRVSFHYAHAPRWMCIDRKPRPLGNEYHEIACCETKIMFSEELFEGNENPLEVTHTLLEFEEEEGSNIASLLPRMTKSI